MYNINGDLIRAHLVHRNVRRQRKEKRVRHFVAHDGSYMHIEKAIDIYLDWKGTHAGKAPKVYRARLDQFANFLGRDKILKEITGDDVVRYHRKMEHEQYVKGSQVKNYSKGTVAYSTRILKNFFKFWQGRGESTINHVEIRSPRYVIPLKRVLSPEEFRRIDDCLDARFFEDMRKKLALHLLWDTGMRVSELCDMDLSHIHDKHPVYGLRSATVRTRKTMRYNLVAWRKDTDDLLSAYIALRLCIDSKTDALFISSTRDTSRRITPRTIQRWVDEVVIDAGLGEGLSPHSFRHGKGHAILSTPGSNIRDVTAILRHASPESSFHYLNLNRDKYLETVAKYLEAV